jgi:hypothetical protein
VIVADDLPAEGSAAAIRNLRAVLRAPHLPAVILASSGGSGAQRPTNLFATAVTDREAPAHNLLFVANELLRADLKNTRASVRRLFGSMCAFRPAGHLVSQYGLTYNVSPSGLYVRTLDPLPAGERVWLELRPPVEVGAVHLRGRVAWVRRYGATGPAPPGFGVHLMADLCPPPDLRAYTAACDRLVG